jgi:hypothetical protein
MACIYVKKSPRGCKGCKFLLREIVAENTEAHSMKQKKK